MQNALAFWEDIEAHLNPLVLVHVTQVNIEVGVNDQICYTPIKPCKGQLYVKLAVLATPWSRIIDSIDHGQGFKVEFFSVYRVLE